MVHKRVSSELYSAGDLKTACGLQIYSDADASKQWKDVTCESCLAKRCERKNTSANNRRAKLLDELDALVDTIGIEMEFGNKRAHEIIKQLRPMR